MYCHCDIRQNTKWLPCAPLKHYAQAPIATSPKIAKQCLGVEDGINSAMGVANMLIILKYIFYLLILKREMSYQETAMLFP